MTSNIPNIILNPTIYGKSGTTPTCSSRQRAGNLTIADLPYGNCAEVGMTWCEAQKRSTAMSQLSRRNTMSMKTQGTYGSISGTVAAKLINRSAGYLNHQEVII
jgi:hypothetical protein